MLVCWWACKGLQQQRQCVERRVRKQPSSTIVDVGRGGEGQEHPIHVEKDYNPGATGGVVRRHLVMVNEGRLMHQ